MKAHTNHFVALLALTIGVSLYTFGAAAQPLQRITMQFRVAINDPLAPTDPVTGTIIYTAPSFLDPIQSFESINMTIAGHSYSVEEIGYRLTM